MLANMDVLSFSWFQYIPINYFRSVHLLAMISFGCFLFLLWKFFLSSLTIIDSFDDLEIMLADIFQSLLFQAFLFFKVSVEKSLVNQMSPFLYIIGCSSFQDLNTLSLFCTWSALTIIYLGRFSSCVYFNVLNSSCISIAISFLIFDRVSDYFLENIFYAFSMKFFLHCSVFSSFPRDIKCFVHTFLFTYPCQYLNIPLCLLVFKP